MNKPKSVEYVIGSQKARDNEDVRVVGRSGNRPVVEQFARPRPHRPVDSAAARNEQEATKELQEKLVLKEGLIKDLQSEVSALKAELDKAHSLNKELESQNKKLALDLSAAAVKIGALNTHDQVRGFSFVFSSYFSFSNAKGKRVFIFIFESSVSFQLSFNKC